MRPAGVRRIALALPGTVEGQDAEVRELEDSWRRFAPPAAIEARDAKAKRSRRDGGGK